MSHLELPSADGSVPTVFLSYRRVDRDVVVELAERLRVDLGPRNVFRDEDDLIGGQNWRTELERRIAAATSILVIIGENWEGVRDDGSRRLDDPDDVVRAEVQQSLRRSGQGAPTPVVVDRGVPAALPDDLAPLLDAHAITVASESLDSESGSDYPRVLAAVWHSLCASVAGGVVVVAGRNAELRLTEFVGSIHEANLIDARFLSRFGSNMCIISARKAEKRASEWPDAIVLVDDDDDEGAFIWSVLRAIDAHRGFTTIAVVGSAAGLALAAGAASAAAGYEPDEFVHAQGGTTSIWGSLTGKVRAASTGAKIAAVATVGLVVAGGVALSIMKDGGSTAAPTVAPVTTAAEPGGTLSPSTDPQATEPAATDAPTTTAVLQPLTDADSPVVAIDISGDAMYFAPDDDAPVLFYDSSAPDAEPRAITIDAAITPDGSVAWVTTMSTGRPQTYRTSPPAGGGLGDEPAIDGYSPAVDPTGTYLASGQYGGRIAEIQLISEGAALDGPPVGESGVGVTALDVMWLDRSRLAVLAQLDDLEDDAADRVVIHLLMIEGDAVVVEQTVVIARGVSADFAFGGAPDDGVIAIHQVGSARVSTFSTGEQAAVIGALDLPGPSRSVWFSGPDQLTWVDADGTLRIDGTVIDGEYRWSRG